MSNTLTGIVRYDGTDFSGWQVQPGQRTVQGAIEGALGQIAGGAAVRVTGAGRTDAGVHALGQVFAFDWPEASDADRLRRSLSKMLAPEIRIESLETAPANFHPIASAVGKRYAYVVAQAATPDPFLDRYAWTLDYDLDRTRVRALAQLFVGEHDFAGFCSSGSSVKSTVRTIHSVDVTDGPIAGPADAANTWRIEFHGNGFLYKMVRNLTGTIIDVARSHLPESTLDDRLHAPMPYHGYTAPAKGLFLVEVEYRHG